MVSHTVLVLYLVWISAGTPVQLCVDYGSDLSIWASSLRTAQSCNCHFCFSSSRCSTPNLASIVDDGPELFNGGCKDPGTARTFDSGYGSSLSMLSERSTLSKSGTSQAGSGEHTKPRCRTKLGGRRGRSQPTPRCPLCTKTFSRPSSLRRHTSSKTTNIASILTLNGTLMGLYSWC